MVGSWTQIACGHFLLFASDRQCWVGFGIIIIIIEGGFDCFDNVVKTLVCHVEIEKFVVKEE